MPPARMRTPAALLGQGKETVVGSAPIGIARMVLTEENSATYFLVSLSYVCARPPGTCEVQPSGTTAVWPSGPMNSTYPESQRSQELVKLAEKVPPLSATSLL